MAGFLLSLPTAKQGLFKDAFTKMRDTFARATQLSVAKLIGDIKAQGNADIQAAGNFSARWTEAFTVDSIPKVTTTSDQYVVRVYFNSSIPYAHIHEFGGTIKPKGNLGSLFGPPLLWIPLRFAKVPRSAGPGANAGQMTAQEYGHTVSRLFRVNRKGGKAPLLLDIKTRQPKYFGVPSVTLKPRFHLRAITKKEAADFQKTFNAAITVADKATK